MLNEKFIDKVVKLVIEFDEVEGITESTESIKRRAEKWLAHYYFDEVETLAAATMAGSYKEGTSWDVIMGWRKLFFPDVPIEETITRIGWLDSKIEEGIFTEENFHIGEIEAAQRDELWR